MNKKLVAATIAMCATLATPAKANAKADCAPPEEEVIEVSIFEQVNVQPIDWTPYLDILETRSDIVVQITNEIGPMYGLDPKLLQAIIFTESSNNPYAVNPAGTCYGYMQVNPRWHYDKMERLGVTDLFDQYGNILVGTDVLVELLNHYDWNLALALMVYNGDSRAFWLNEIGEYSDYVKKIFSIRDRLTEMEENVGSAAYNSLVKSSLI